MVILTFVVAFVNAFANLLDYMLNFAVEHFETIRMNQHHRKRMWWIQLKTECNLICGGFGEMMLKRSRQRVGRRGGAT